MFLYYYLINLWKAKQSYKENYKAIKQSHKENSIPPPCRAGPLSRVYVENFHLA